MIKNEKHNNKSKNANFKVLGILDSTCCIPPSKESTPLSSIFKTYQIQPKTLSTLKTTTKPTENFNPKITSFPLSTYSKSTLKESNLETEAKILEKSENPKELYTNFKPSKKSKKPFIPLELIEDGYFDAGIGQSNQNLMIPPLEFGNSKISKQVTREKSSGMRASTSMVSSFRSSDDPGLSRNKKKKVKEESKSNLKINFKVGGDGEESDQSDGDDWDCFGGVIDEI